MPKKKTLSCHLDAYNNQNIFRSFKHNLETYKQMIIKEIDSHIDVCASVFSIKFRINQQ